MIDRETVLCKFEHFSWCLFYWAFTVFALECFSAFSCFFCLCHWFTFTINFKTKCCILISCHLLDRNLDRNADLYVDSFCYIQLLFSSPHQRFNVLLWREVSYLINLILRSHEVYWYKIKLTWERMGIF